MASVEKRYNKAGNLISFRIHVFHGRDEFGKQLPPFIKTVRVPPELNARQIETLIQRETVHFEEECELITAHEKEEAAKAAEPKCISFEDFAMSEDSLNLVLQKNNQTKPHQAWQKYK